jgi:hypothetical protein
MRQAHVRINTAAATSTVTRAARRCCMLCVVQVNRHGCMCIDHQHAAVSHSSSVHTLEVGLPVALLQASAKLAEAAPPSGAERRRFYSRTTTEALKEARQHQRKGAHPYRVVLGEVSRQHYKAHRAQPASERCPACGCIARCVASGCKVYRFNSPLHAVTSSTAAGCRALCACWVPASDKQGPCCCAVPACMLVLPSNGFLHH